ncbi:fungal hydrophobin-domain-containing protein [Xylaria acuta]|nr:fungal hydrophobin-domain-containing protein [Xylaria acuta]
MKFLPAIVIIHLGAAWAAALPPQLDNRQFYVPCPDGLYREPLCCERDVLGIQDINCDSVWPPPLGASEYRNSCANSGKYARCCIAPPLGGYVLCKNPDGFPPDPWD